MGPCFRKLVDGALVQESRTTARSEGIDKELAKYPWMDLVHYQIFLDGFDAGEQYCPNNSDSECKPVQWS